VGNVRRVDPSLDIFLRQSLRLDKVSEKDNSLGPVQCHRLAGDVHDERDHRGEVLLGAEAGEAGYNYLLRGRMDYGNQYVDPNLDYRQDRCMLSLSCGSALRSLLCCQCVAYLGGISRPLSKPRVFPTVPIDFHSVGLESWNHMELVVSDLVEALP